MNRFRIPSVLLALVLQFVPLCRVLQTSILPTASPLAIMLKWITVAATVGGAVDAYSGVSTVFKSPTTATGKVGTVFSYRIQTGPDAANRWAATPLPPGLTLNTSSGVILGTPTQAGVTVTHVTASDNGRADRTITMNLTITITGGAVPPTITASPLSQTVLQGAAASFSVTATGDAPLAYVWKKDTKTIPGATASVFTIPSTTATDAGSYTVTVSNGAGAATSSAAVLAVNVPPSIAVPPAAADVVAGSTVTFSVQAAGTGPFTYQWKKGGGALRGQTQPTLTLTGVTAVSAGDFTVTVTSPFGSVTSDPATLTVRTPPSITGSPLALTVLEGGTANFLVTADGTAPLSYQWQHDTADLPGQTAATLTLSNITTSQAGKYRVKVTNSAGTATSDDALLTVTPKALTPATLRGPSMVGGKFQFAFDSTPGRNYQIQVNPTLAPNQWKPLSNVTATAAATLFTHDQPAGSVQNYRVQGN